VATDQLDIRPVRRLHGAIAVPGDKSISHRYALFGGIARGTTSVTHLSPGADVAATVGCLRGLGVAIEQTGPHAITVNGRGRKAFRQSQAALDAMNSGTTMRLLSGVLSACDFTTTLVGDASLSKRPMRRVIDPLTAMGARFESQDGRAPLTIHGGSLSGITWKSPVPSAQVKSAIMLAGLSASGTTTVVEPMSTRDHSERAFPAFGLTCRTVPGEGTSVAISVDGGQEAVAPSGLLTVPGDPSSAAVWAAAASAIPGSMVELTGVCLNPGRLGFVRALERLGAAVTIDVTGEVGGESVGTIRIGHGTNRHAVIEAAEVPSLIDELPVLAARAALGASLEVSGAEELRVKESDRITALVTGFRQLGVSADEKPDGFIIDGSRKPNGGTADAAHDHRLVMAFTLVGLGSVGGALVTGAEAVAVSYPDFASDLAGLTR
jgi:3-phosphoshikimate 1-carboxyvinyltransferase